MIRKAAGRFYETEVDDAVVIMDADKGTFHSLGDTGLAIWRLIDGARSEGDIVDLLQARYAVDRETCVREVAAFLDQVAEAGFVERG